MQDESLANELKSMSEAILNKIIVFKQHLRDFYGSETVSFDHTLHVVYTAKDLKYRYNLHSIKYADDVKKMKEEYPNTTVGKCLEFFTTDGEKLESDALIKDCIDIMSILNDIHAKGCSISLEDFVDKDKLKINQKITKKIISATTVYCKNAKQEEVMAFVEEYTKLVKRFRARGLFGNRAIDLLPSKVIDQDGLKVNESHIAQRIN